ncbi:hypothetical protein TEA_007032 [Camellia sinensis var. sinensis]|uniref:Uncharacterized protein n=1 Tax=Camellia sinensis var. sinensis TaxID=542762 RepID=A0A4S4DBV2_CAMSN|nr:hypothetical protein TEA_007032 [Camellia sinensis var. sinensis]
MGVSSTSSPHPFELVVVTAVIDVAVMVSRWRWPWKPMKSTDKTESKYGQVRAILQSMPVAGSASSALVYNFRPNQLNYRGSKWWRHKCPRVEASQTCSKVVLQDFIPQIKSRYKSFEDVFFNKVKDELIDAREHPFVAGGVALIASLLLMQGFPKVLMDFSIGGERQKKSQPWRFFKSERFWIGLDWSGVEPFTYLCSLRRGWTNESWKENGALERECQWVAVIGGASTSKSKEVCYSSPLGFREGFDEDCGVVAQYGLCFLDIGGEGSMAIVCSYVDIVGVLRVRGLGAACGVISEWFLVLKKLGRAGATTARRAGSRRFLFRHTFGRLQSDEARFLRAEKNVKELNLSVDLMKKESRKLLERAALAEKDMKHGQSDLMNAGTQIQRLAKSVTNVEVHTSGSGLCCGLLCGVLSSLIIIQWTSYTCKDRGTRDNGEEEDGRGRGRVRGEWVPWWRLELDLTTRDTRQQEMIAREPRSLGRERERALCLPNVGIVSPLLVVDETVREESLTATR